MDLQKTYNCNICDKKYKHRQSLNNHNRKFHPKNEPNIRQNPPNILQNPPKSSIINPLECIYCHKIFKRSDFLKKHNDLNRCKIKKKLEKENAELKKQNQELKEKYGKEIEELKKQLLELINRKGKIHHKTLQKINKQNNIQNNTQNNINIIGFCHENLNELFSKKEKLKILKNRYGSLNSLIEYAHFNDKYPELKNIRISNLNNNVAHKFDNKKQKFIATTKDDLLNDLIMFRMFDIEHFQGSCEDKLNEKENEILNKMTEQFTNDEDKFIEERKEGIKYLVYNNTKNDVE